MTPLGITSESEHLVYSQFPFLTLFSILHLDDLVCISLLGSFGFHTRIHSSFFMYVMDGLFIFIYLLVFTYLYHALYLG